jgi:anaerobic nitric oxide reductase transcription regulator
MSQITSNSLLALSLDLATSLTSKDRFGRLLNTVRKTIACDAVALLSFSDNLLTPLAQQGLNNDTLGRRFPLDEHPRFETICQSPHPVRFNKDSPLPDPYDGLLIDHDGDLPVHACMGLPLYFEQRLIGILTLDSLSPCVFDDITNRTLEIISALAAVSLNTAMTLDLLERQALHSQQVVETLALQPGNIKCQEIIGSSVATKQLIRDIRLVGPSPFTVLIQGETGVGKELVASAIHSNSSRAHGAIVHVNCAAMPENLIESELFGHVKGAFTGAETTRAGKFSVANGGTLFLDEIGELPLSAQSKLLRVLQNNQIQALGQDSTETVDVRIIAATNRNLSKEVEEGRFRADLYHRLSVYPINVPPLRERLTDVHLLAGYFCERLKRKLGIIQISLTTDFVQVLEGHDWPGNVRELEHFINRVTLKAKVNTNVNGVIKLRGIDAAELIDALTIVPSVKTTQMTMQQSIDNTDLKLATNHFQRQHIENILTQEQGNWASAARRLNTDRSNLMRLAKRLGIILKKTVSHVSTPLQ